ncbi:exported hypothetical protein [Nitrospina gracilis 3/211]|uniref:Uncharacterized protein n=1 Tax=Nitrospina gracilis (strain 3/211) TaxID=1266370 RepID=M1YN61_NITG3|nr:MULTISPECIES: hypothetical protein [Nitrospina]MCF8722511.1 MFS superfamily sulfate permease-like transporter [Nitrospina sp. Nb-3]CCQ91942.1 exported hypothetical protein [Nitrospina gracilis 3/211]
MVVFLVAIPLSLGIGIVSGVSAESALIAAIVGGIVVGLGFALTVHLFVKNPDQTMKNTQRQLKRLFNMS